MQTIGLVGGIASGKSEVARHFVALGAGLLDADRAGHEVLRMPEVEEAVRRRWGERALGADGRVDRRRLAKIVFADSPEAARERKYLEELTHPEIGRLVARQAAEFEAAGRRAVVLDAPLLLEAGWDKLCDTLIFVDAPRELRIARARRRGWDAQTLAAREAAQESLEEKRRRANLVVDNSGTPEQTRAQVARIWRELAT